MEGGNARARKNWGKLRDIIRSGTQARRKKQYKFALFEKHMHTQQQILNTHYVLEDTHLLQRTPIPTVNQLLHFDSPIDATGKWVWEAEEVAAYYLVRRAETYMLDLVQQTGSVRVLELGAGSSGLASIAFKITTQKLGFSAVSIEITDGEQQNIAFLDQNLKLNCIPPQSGQAKHMLWGDNEAIQNLALNLDRKTYQMLIISDCLFFQQFHKELLLSIDSYLSPKGFALLINPSRGNSLHNFLQLSKNKNFKHQTIDFEDKLYLTEVERLRNSQNFRQDTDFPYILQLRREDSEKQK